MTEPPAVVLPRLCKRHESDLVRERLRLDESDPWRAAMITAHILLFQLVSADDRVWKRADGKSENLSLVLNELGCLACWDGAKYRTVYRLLQTVGLEFAAKIAQGKAVHPDWPLDLRAKPDGEATT